MYKSLHCVNLIQCNKNRHTHALLICTLKLLCALLCFIDFYTPLMVGQLIFALELLIAVNSWSLFKWISSISYYIETGRQLITSLLKEVVSHATMLYETWLQEIIFPSFGSYCPCILLIWLNVTRMHVHYISYFLPLHNKQACFYSIHWRCIVYFCAVQILIQLFLCLYCLSLNFI